MRSFGVDLASRTKIDNAAPLEHFKGTTEGAGGTLVVDARDLAATRGEVKIDLASLRSHTFPKKDDNDAPTTHARTWLEAVVNDHVDESMRWAVFRIEDIRAVEPASDVRVIPAVTSFDVATRPVLLTSAGLLFVHGHAAPKTVKLRADLFWPRDATDGAPASVVARTVEPLQVNLADHAIVARDMFGKEAKGAFSLLGTKVGDVPDVTFELAMR